MSGLKRNGPRAVAAARKAKIAAFGKPTPLQYSKLLPDASGYARAWLAPRGRVSMQAMPRQRRAA